MKRRLSFIAFLITAACIFAQPVKISLAAGDTIRIPGSETDYSIYKDIKNVKIQEIRRDATGYTLILSDSKQKDGKTVEIAAPDSKLTVFDIWFTNDFTKTIHAWRMNITSIDDFGVKIQAYKVRTVKDVNDTADFEPVYFDKN